MAPSDFVTRETVGDPRPFSTAKLRTAPPHDYHTLPPVTTLHLPIIDNSPHFNALYCWHYQWSNTAFTLGEHFPLLELR